MIEPHIHEGNQTPKIESKNLLPYPIVSVAPVDLAQNGTIRLFYDGVNYKIYIRINNTWVSATLT